jgi:hypothetical protein
VATVAQDSISGPYVFEPANRQMAFRTFQTFGLLPGLPDCIFSNQKSQFGKFLGDLAMEDVRIFYGHFVYFPDIWYILWPFGIISPVLVYFSAFWYVAPRKIWQPCLLHFFLSLFISIFRSIYLNLRANAISCIHTQMTQQGRQLSTFVKKEILW